MTNVSTNHPDNIPYLELTGKGRQISFRRDCLGEIKIYRSVNGGKPGLLAEQIRTPFVDESEFPTGTTLTYTVEVELHQEKKQYELEARL